MKIKMRALRLDSYSYMILNFRLFLNRFIGKASRPLLENFKRKWKRVMPSIQFISIKDNHFLFDKFLPLFIEANFIELIVCCTYDLRSQFTIIILFRSTLRNLNHLYKLLDTSAWWICSNAIPYLLSVFEWFWLWLEGSGSGSGLVLTVLTDSKPLSWSDMSEKPLIPAEMLRRTSPETVSPAE